MKSKSMISLGMAATLITSPVVELGGKAVQASDTKDAHSSDSVVKAEVEKAAELMKSVTSEVNETTPEQKESEMSPGTDVIEESEVETLPETDVAEETETEMSPETGAAEETETEMSPETGAAEETETETSPETGAAEETETETLPETDVAEETETETSPETDEVIKEQEVPVNDEEETDVKNESEGLVDDSSSLKPLTDAKNQQAKATLEVEVHFPTPMASLDDINLDLTSMQEKLGTIKLVEANGNLQGASYRIEVLDSNREVITKDNDPIYFVRVIIEGLSTGQYSVELSGAGYVSTSVENIDLTKYSQRVKLSTSKVETNRNEELPSDYPTAFLAGDFDNDGIIKMSDYEIIIRHLGSTELQYDLNRDGIVDILDVTYVFENQDLVAKKAKVEATDVILNLEEIYTNEEDLTLGDGQSLSDLFSDSSSGVSLSKGDATAPTEENPLKVDIQFGSTEATDSAVIMETVVLKMPQVAALNDEVGFPEKGYITYEDAEGNKKDVAFDQSMVRSTGDIEIPLGSQVAVKKITINVTANRGNKNISQIAKVEFLNNVYEKLPEPEMNIPKITSVETSTNLHDERITLEWEAQSNVTGYEVTYQMLDEKTGEVKKTKRLQTIEPKINILDKDITAYSLYRVKVQSLNGTWQSGYIEADVEPTAYDGRADNVDENYQPIEDYYAGNIGSVTEIQVIPINEPEEPINLVTTPGFKSFSVTWEKHIQARDFDIYYRKVGTEKWIKANQNHIEVTEDSLEVTKPDSQYLVRAGSYTVNGLDDNSVYEVRVTATNHLGTSKMSKTYLASTTSVTPPVMTEYNLINRPNPSTEIGTEHIVKVENTIENGSSGVTFDTENAIVDGDFTTVWKVNGWESGALNYRNWTPVVTFDDTYEIGSISLARTLEKGYTDNLYMARITYWDESGKETTFTLDSSHVRTHGSNGHTYYTIQLDEPIQAKKIRVATTGWAGATLQSFSEVKFYAYDSLEDDVEALFSDELRIALKDTVTQYQIDSLVERVNTPDSVSGEYHPNKATILKELELAQQLLDEQSLSERVVTLDASLRDGDGAIGITNTWQALGFVARPSVDENKQSEKISVYLGSSDQNTRVEIAFLQAYGLPGEYISKTVTIAPGRTEITIPEIISADVEKGGAIMAKVVRGSESADIQLRISNATEIPHLNVADLINDSSKESEVKALLYNYIDELATYVRALPSMYPTEVSAEDKLNNIYTYDKTTAALNWTDIEGESFTLSFPATEVLRGIQSGLTTRDAQVDRLYDALLAWEQEMKVVYAKKGVFTSVQDFNQNGSIDEDDQAYYNKHKAPQARLNVKYQRMIMGAAAYASSHHVGVGFDVASYLQGVPYKFDEQGNVTNADQAHLYGALMGHEIGHVVDIANRLYPETSNNLLADLTATLLDEDAPKFSSALNELYKKVTSNTYGLSTNRNVVLGMLWQPHLAYDDESTYQMLFSNFDGDLSDDTYFAKLNRAYREMTAEEKADGDRDQWLIRMSSKAAGKNLTDFYEAHGLVANETTLTYVSQFDKETRPIQYLNDEARRRRLEGTAEMSQGTTLQAEFGSINSQQLKDQSYVNQKEIPLKLSVSKDSDRILGYEIRRNGEAVAFVLRDETNDVTNYTDIITTENNRTYEYKVVAYDYALNATNTVELGTIKVRHDGAIANSTISATSSTIDVIEDNNDLHGAVPNKGLANLLDGDASTIYEGRKLTQTEYNELIKNQSNSGFESYSPTHAANVVLDLQSTKSVIGLKYTAPTTKKLFRTKVASNAINKYRIEVSVDGKTWTKVNEGTFKLDPSNPEEMVYFGKELADGTIQTGNQLYTYQVRYVRLSAINQSEISIADLELVGPPGDNIEIGMSTDGQTYSNGIGLLAEDYIYQAGTTENEERKIPKGSVIITGEYSGNPAFNVPLVLNENEEHIADEYHGILLADLPAEGQLEEISQGTWIYWVEPNYKEQFMKNNQIFAELYRMDSADLTTDGQRLVSNTFKVEVPEKLPTISLTQSKLRNQQVITELSSDQLQALTR
ncbi:M60 family metallopeptidase [Turicibacter sanguinis]|uniref:M60 family metallopeptidase n=1 Tax=Turicibacter sanguinis TaxID=154288 RepID=UPI0018A9EBE4|nr:M60 family metallopeptidase [Turicibacter sanguinis]MDB8553733.1 M60 family metallopeptidase [Turicibacter sanguinis]